MGSTKENENLESLDDYIKNRGIAEQFDMFSYRNSKFVNLSLNEFVKESKTNLKIREHGNGRFDRPSLRDNSDNDTDSDDEKDLKIEVAEDDIDMKDESNEHIHSYETSLDPDNADRIKRFETIEQVNNIKVSSQAWRLENKNIIVDRPKNMPTLTTLGSKPRQDNINRVQTGRINKVYKNHYNDFVSTFQNVKTGKFVEKGGFTYKHDDNGLIGIDRQNKTAPQNQQNSKAAPQINIHMDWNGLFNQMKDANQVTTNLQPKEEPTTPQQLSRSSSFSSNSEVSQDFSKLKFAAADLIEFLKLKKTKKN